MNARGIRAAIEIKWSDRPLEDFSEIKGLLAFAEKNEFVSPHPLGCTTLTKQDARHYDNKEVVFIPTSLYCFILGQSLDTPEFGEKLSKSMVQTK